MIDLDRARRETPGCQQVTHFNNAGAALMPEPVLAATLNHLRREAQIGGYEAADKMAAELAQFYETTARRSMPTPMFTTTPSTWSTPAAIFPVCHQATTCVQLYASRLNSVLMV